MDALIVTDPLRLGVFALLSAVVGACSAIVIGQVCKLYRRARNPYPGYDLFED